MNRNLEDFSALYCEIQAPIYILLLNKIYFSFLLNLSLFKFKGTSCCYKKASNCLFRLKINV